MDLLQRFLEFKEKQRKTKRGGVVMYDVFGYYKYLTESELFKYYADRFTTE